MNLSIDHLVFFLTTVGYLLYDLKVMLNVLVFVLKVYLSFIGLEISKSGNIVGLLIEHDLGTSLFMK